MEVKRKVYLDYGATTPVAPGVLEVMLPCYQDRYGNAASIHQFGRAAKAVTDLARERVAGLIGADAGEITFTGGGTEATNWAIKGVAGKKGGHIITSKVEHHSVLDTCKALEAGGCRVTYLPVDAYGMVSPDQVEAAVTKETVLISLMYVNNEVGSVNPIRAIGRIARARGVLFHTDAVQGYGKLPIHVDDDGIDLLSLSGHKIYGPKGVGALYCRRGTAVEVFIHGGSQERGRRAGTLNVPGAVGLGEAADICRNVMEEEADRLKGLRGTLLKGLQSRTEGITMNGHPEERQPGNLHISVEGVDGQELLLGLDLKGIAVSTGSACMSGSIEPSHVLEGMNVPIELVFGSIRLTLGRQTTDGDIDYVISVFQEVVARAREAAEEVDVT